MAATSQTEYKIRPPFKTKFRAAEAKPLIEKVIHDVLATGSEQDCGKQIAEQAKEALKGLKKDAHYKYLV